MVDKKKCIGCGTCVAICPVEAISFGTDGKAVIDKTKCIRCGACQASCPVEAIDINKVEENKKN
ncbi:MAG: 4Fe-4S binding protein [Clostridia bacterium]|nr:4Fe-4S binding protein [Clostridia bacterium]